MLKLIQTIRTLPLAGVAAGIKNAFDTHIKTDIKSIVNDVVLPCASIILVVCLVLRAATMFIKYRRGEEIGWGLLVGLFVGLVITTTASLWMWNLLGVTTTPPAVPVWIHTFFR